MEEKTLVGAVQKSNDKMTTYFYLGIADLDLQRFVDINKATGINDTITPSRMLCVAVEREGNPDTNGKIAGFAYLRENGKILITSIDKLREEYLNVYAREAIIYYDKGR